MAPEFPPAAPEDEDRQDGWGGARDGRTSTVRDTGCEGYPRVSNPDGRTLEIHLAADESLRLAPGDSVTVAEYNDRVFRFADRNSHGAVRLESVGYLDRLSGVRISEGRLAEAVARGDVRPVDAARPANRVWSTAVAVGERVATALARSARAQ